ncbi:1-deoxy-D-xylulose 5-phosphate reductoisomerase [Campylobacter iguaniorum]|uniref:1-deoxy-D-xylulose-5-phosphate reductoisomerase n=1 Tax=Campylobacter iguaniorum TaxID=1244531 RepID=UPI0007C90BC9|nr:1-deoxy-D-xylulose-5-phosphate reductoisomerase [Campylobacter iguaniorum]ANE35265.1 1-deoxy-D-xylulose 5-phosphate reductoisomerase [Campylobacter iguaniorum]
MIILGSTGSIGKNACLLAGEHGIKINALACYKNYKELNEQIAKFNPKLVYIKDENLKKYINHKHVFTQIDGMVEFLKACKSEFEGDLLINSLVGFDGLEPSYHAQKLGFKLALANKESLVAGGKFLDTKAINPIDSEHFGVKFLLKSSPKIKKLIITASGGAFYNLSQKELKTATPQMALKHPNWDMGAKITIDSATMANKLFEVLEAYYLYSTKSIDACIERTSSIHALIDFVDGSSTAHISKTDMKLAIAHAIGLGEKEILENVNLLELKSIKFRPINLNKYRIFALKDEVLKNPDLGVIINAANDETVYKFLEGKAGFLDISENIFKALDKFGSSSIKSIEDVFEINQKVREFCKGI